MNSSLRRRIARYVPGELTLNVENSTKRTKRVRVLVTRSFAVLTLCLAASFAISAEGSPAEQAATNPARPAPRAVAPFTTFDFGDVYTGDIISHVFVIKNEGDAELLITDFKSDCGCTVTRSDRVIPPGREGTAEVEVQTLSQSGMITKGAKLQTNDPERPTIIFTLNANVVKGSPVRQGKYIGPLFLSSDSRLSMYARAGKKATAELSVTADRVAVNVLRVEAGTKQFVPRVEVIQPGRNYKILVESIEIETGGLYQDRLRVITDNPALPAFNIELTLRVYPRE
ncbi:MAG TPA: DUF1573 domain-containing protein [Blastocatellia bacterium]|nr:DUF1573 domain-containing protein [Blastocatellia bacterium]